jgi:hypothetical protein
MKHSEGYMKSMSKGGSTCMHCGGQVDAKGYAVGGEVEEGEPGPDPFTEAEEGLDPVYDEEDEDEYDEEEGVDNFKVGSKDNDGALFVMALKKRKK